MRKILRLAAAVSSLTTAIRRVKAASRTDYINNAINATNVLIESWWDSSNGLFQDLWWQTPSVLTTLADLTVLDPDTFLDTSKYFFQTSLEAAAAANGGTFLDDFYDDEGWWAMAWIKVYDITQNDTYLNTARDIFSDMVKGANATCGGHWWDKEDDANTAIANELYLAVAASLANRSPDEKAYYEGIAVDQANWFLSSGLINENNTIYDGLDLSDCQPMGLVYTYNQGVTIGGLIELHKLTSNQTYLDVASKIAHGTLDNLCGVNGILIEPGYPGALDITSAMFKGVFARNLAYLQAVAGDDAYVTFLQQNADAIWTLDREDDGQLGPNWQGPYFAASASSQGSAMGCLVGAAAVSS